MGNIETATKFSRLESISSIEDNHSFSLFVFFGFFFKCFFTITKEDFFIVKKMSLEIGFKEV